MLWRRVSRDLRRVVKRWCRTVSTDGRSGGKFTEMNVDDWHGRWIDRNIGFHKNHIHPLLEKHLHMLINNRSNIKIFYPLCGKAVDMKWLADKGHTVIGVEGSDIAIKEFFDKEDLKYCCKEVPQIKGTLYYSEDQRIRLYHGDFFSFNCDIEGQVDAIWDRCSIVAVNRNERQKYAEVMKPLMKTTCQYLLVTVEYDETIHPGPPHHFPESQIPELFGDVCNIQKIDSIDALEDRHRGWGLDYLVEKLHLLTLKS